MPLTVTRNQVSHAFREGLGHTEREETSPGPIKFPQNHGIAAAYLGDPRTGKDFDDKSGARRKGIKGNRRKNAGFEHWDSRSGKTGSFGRS